MPANRLRGQIAALLFGSGFCALVYQICWLREFRLIFGASTAATAAVTAIFIGGLGLGGIVIGRRADRHSNPLMLYGNLEVWIALSSAASPLLLFLVRSLYIGLGGTVVLGLIAGTVLRLVLAGLVLSVPTLLMGGTLPAAARAAETDDDTGRRSVALLYGANTLGAVAGCLTANFFMLETFGNRSTLWIAACLNVLVALLARNLARAKAAAEPEVSAVGPLVPQPAVQRLVITAAAVVGFAFFLMELVWYRMLGPLLSGTIFSFGLILAVALLGIGLGGLFYALAIPNRRATLRAFAYTCLAEAFFVALPLALGDRIAILALLVRPLGTVGLVGFAAGWAVVALLVVLPAAFTAGFQFPLLIALLGPGRENVGREVGLVYVANTAGAIVGSLAGGFGLLPILSAPGCWRAVAALLLALSAAAFVTSLRNGSRRLALLAPAATALIVIGFLTATGPTAVWRHSQIGVGRVALETIKTSGEMRQWTNYRRRATVWEAEGVESSVALDATSGFAFVLNGRTDGNAVADGSTQVMGGLLGAAFHSHPQRSMVIGLGTGSTAGWLASVPGMERVDVVELEPA
ncbi:MAG TPA: spermidine synthase, partial [Thermoanaerobaculia bacterium]|nr:spermidine synthase [Thermoanaerobaculia bacterium]